MSSGVRCHPSVWCRHDCPDELAVARVALPIAISIPEQARIRRTHFCDLLAWRDSPDGCEFSVNIGFTTVRVQNETDAFLMKMIWL